MDAKPTPDLATAAPATLAGELTPGQVRALKWAIVAMSIMIVVGLLAIVFRIVYLASGRGQQATVTAGPGADARVPLPAGATIRAIALDSGRLAIHHESIGGPGITIVDIGSGKVVSRMTFAPEPPRP